MHSLLRHRNVFRIMKIVKAFRKHSRSSIAVPRLISREVLQAETALHTERAPTNRGCQNWEFCLARNFSTSLRFSTTRLEPPRQTDSKSMKVGKHEKTGCLSWPTSATSSSTRFHAQQSRDSRQCNQCGSCVMMETAYGILVWTVTCERCGCT